MLGNCLSLLCLVAQTALVVQNGAVVLCSGLMVVLLYFDNGGERVLNGTMEMILIPLVIFVAVVANLGSEASKIALERDWIVVLAGGNQEKLSSKFLNVYTCFCFICLSLVSVLVC